MPGHQVSSHVVCLAGRSADELRWTRQPWRTWPSVAIGALGPRQLARLGAILGAGTSDQLADQFSLLAGESQESPWVISLPPSLVERLQSLAPDAVESMAALWLLAGEDGAAWSPRDLIEHLAGITSFMRSQRGPFVLHIVLTPEGRSS